MSEAAPAASAYPVTYDVQPQLQGRNRVTCAFRLILAIPHIVLVGGPGLVFGGGGFRNGHSGGLLASLPAGGVLGLVAGVMSIISWFAIVLTGKQPKGLWDFPVFYLKWRSRAVAYTALLRDEYPPFGDGEYPVTFDLGAFPETRDRLSVALRLIFAIPHIVALIFIGIAWGLTAIAAWFIILFTGGYPESIYNFAIGYLRWSLRVEAYLLLIRDEYPPFSLS